MRVRACLRVGVWMRICACFHLALFIQHSTRVRHIVTSFAAPQAQPNFSTLFFFIFILFYFYFRHYFTNGAIFGKMLLNIKWVFWFSLQILSKTFLILRSTVWDTVINVRTSSCKVPVIFSDLNENLIFSTDFEQSSNVKFNQNPFSGSRVLSCGRTDGQTVTLRS
jgi:hypothetical protein